MAQTITMRQDGNNYVEGMTIGKYLLINVLMGSILQPGITCTEHEMQDMGKISVPKISGTRGTVTALCADGTPGETTTDMVFLDINKKATEKFDGCFTTAGIADKSWEQGLNTYKMTSLREQYEAYVIDYLSKANDANNSYENVAESTVDKADYVGNPSGYLNALKKEYVTNTRGVRATVALCSVDFYYSIVDAGINLGTPLGDEMFVQGTEAVTRLSGMLLVPTMLMDEFGMDVIVLNPSGLHIGRPTSPKAIGQNVLGSGASVPDNISFTDGLMSFWETDAKKGIVETYVHKPFGILVPEKNWVLANKFTPRV